MNPFYRVTLVNPSRTIREPFFVRAADPRFARLMVRTQTMMEYPQWTVASVRLEVGCK